MIARRYECDLKNILGLATASCRHRPSHERRECSFFLSFLSRESNEILSTKIKCAGVAESPCSTLCLKKAESQLHPALPYMAVCFFSLSL
jgi:hypothetical protein